MTLNLHFRRFRPTILALSALLLPTLGHAQSSQTWEGGIGTNPTVWDNGISSDWDASPGDPWASGYNNANFTNASASNTVTVDSIGGGAVAFNELYFDQAGNWVIQPNLPATITYNPASDDFLTEYSQNTSDPTFLEMDSGSGTVTVTAPIDISDIGGNQQGWFFNYSSSSLSVGNINFGAFTIPSGNTRRVDFDSSTTTGSITLTGTYTGTDANNQGTFNFGDRNGNNEANYYLASTANFEGLNPDNYHGSSTLSLIQGNLYIDTSNFGAGNNIGLTGDPDNNSTIYLQGAQTIAASIYDSMKNSGSVRASDGVSLYGRPIINQSTAAESTWSGNVNQDGTNMELSAVAGGRLNFSGNLSGDSPEGLVIAGDGVVVLSSAGGNGYDQKDGQGNLQVASTIAADLQSGTTLITNTSGSAFGNASYNNGNYFGSNGSYRNGTVNIESAAILGGSGISSQLVQSMAAGSIIAPGDAGQAGLSITPSIATLHLIGGISAASGLTMDFKLNGASNDALDLGAGSFTLAGVVTVNFTNLGTVLTGTPYTLASFSGAKGTWSDAGATFDINAPAGYLLNSAYGTNGYSFNTTADTFSVEFSEVPEPSTYAMMLGGLVLLGFCVRRKLA